MIFYEVKKETLNDINNEKIIKAYVLEKDKDILGYGIITNTDINKIQVFIKEEYRSNGYGKYLFGKMVEEIKKENYKDVNFVIKKENYRIKNIIVYFGALHLYTDKEEECYVLPIK